MEIGTVQSVDIEQQMRSAYLDRVLAYHQEKIMLDEVMAKPIWKTYGIQAKQLLSPP